MRGPDLTIFGQIYEIHLRRKYLLDPDDGGKLSVLSHRLCKSAESAVDIGSVWRVSCSVNSIRLDFFPALSVRSAWGKFSKSTRGTKDMQNSLYPSTRLRRLRKTRTMRELFCETTVSANDLIYPVFVAEGIEHAEPISSMPGVVRIPEASLDEEVRNIAADGVRSLMLFGVPLDSHKDEIGSESLTPDGLMARMIRIAKKAAPDMLIIADCCFCEYTSHSHCGVIRDGHVHNDLTLENLGRQAVNAADAGADVVAPSAMMDGQVAAIRAALDAAGHVDTPIMAYSSKFASSFYGPFREAAGSQLKGDRKAYQMNPLNGREALRESMLDEAEGADMLMVKPGLPYLDVLARLRERTLLPLVTYQVSGEYAMIKFAAAAGAIDERMIVCETLGAFKRAGADLILTYFARDIAREGF